MGAAALAVGAVGAVGTGIPRDTCDVGAEWRRRSVGVGTGIPEKWRRAVAVAVSGRWVMHAKRHHASPSATTLPRWLCVSPRIVLVLIERPLHLHVVDVVHEAGQP